jgi:hypothetical protein
MYVNVRSKCRAAGKQCNELISWSDWCPLNSTLGMTWLAMKLVRAFLKKALAGFILARPLNPGWGIYPTSVFTSCLL